MSWKRHSNKLELIPKAAGGRCSAKTGLETFCKVYCRDCNTDVFLGILLKISEQPGCSCDTLIALNNIYNKSIQNEEDNG